MLDYELDSDDEWEEEEEGDECLSEEEEEGEQDNNELDGYAEDEEEEVCKIFSHNVSLILILGWLGCAARLLVRRRRNGG